jgi:hypothetical protein
MVTRGSLVASCRDPSEKFPYVIQVEKFNAMFASRYQRELVMASLIKAKHKPKKKNSVAVPQPQILWPDGERRRSYKIALPKSGKAA